MQCTGSYRTVGDLNDCFKHCTADAKCKAFVTTQEIPTIEKLVNWNRQQSCALLLATMGLGQIPITISKYEWRHFRWLLRKGLSSNIRWTRQLLLDMKWICGSTLNQPTFYWTIPRYLPIYILLRANRTAEVLFCQRRLGRRPMGFGRSWLVNVILGKGASLGHGALTQAWKRREPAHYPCMREPVNVFGTFTSFHLHF